MLEIYTDGSCLRNQNTKNAGGWGCILIDQDSGKLRKVWGHEKNTTNNRMEMTAAIKALHSIRKRVASDVVIYSDSNLLIKGMTEWLSGWKSNGWKTASRKSVENKDLWKKLDELSSNHRIVWKHVKAHSGHEGNDLADELAKRGANGSSGVKNYIHEGKTIE